MRSSPITTRSATSLAASIANGELSSLEVVEAHIERILVVNHRINAVVQTRFDAARQEARAADVLLGDQDAGELPLLHGVPCTIKECFAFAGHQQTSGLVDRIGSRATEDATCVARLRAAGAIPMGLTNLSELCMWLESSNRVYGRTNNPYDTRRIVGGSSGGEGAIIAAGASPFGLGSDIGGSIRLPAFFCGVFGHKPSGGLVPGSGQYPIAHGPALRYLSTGPLCRRAEDLWPLLGILAGPDGIDRGCEEISLGDPARVDLAGLRVLHIPDNGRTPVSDELRRAQERVADHLSSLGARVVSPAIPLLRDSFEIWGSMLHEAGGPTFAELMGNGHTFHAGREFVRWLTRRTPHTLPAIGLAALEGTTDLPRGRAARWVEKGRELRAQLDAELGDDGILLLPPFASTAPRHSEPIRRPFRFVYTAILNTMHTPATAVPLGLGEGGLPLGVQVAAKRGNDHLCIAVAQELEGAFGGWVPTEVVAG
jgi:fatty acid amide hydrolase 2